MGPSGILGECGAILRTEYDPAGRFRTYWDEYITRAAHQRGLVPMYWDNGYTANHQFGVFDRATAIVAFPIPSARSSTPRSSGPPMCLE